MAIKQSVFEEMRDCVKEAFIDGCERGHEFQKMRHAIIAELNRLGIPRDEIKEHLIEWNKKCEKPLSLSEQRSQLLGYVDWFFGQEGKKTGCKALESYCVGKDKCYFYQRTTTEKRQKTKKLPFEMEELESYLTVRFKAAGYKMLLVVKVLMKYQHEKATGDVIYIGYRKICSLLMDGGSHNFLPMDIHRIMRLLEDEGVIKKVVQGKSGNFSGFSNGYRFLPWSPVSNKADGAIALSYPGELEPTQGLPNYTQDMGGDQSPRRTQAQQEADDP